MKNIFIQLYIPLVVLGILARLAIIVIPGDSIITPWSGRGDMEAYVLVASNLVSGYGYSYAHVPSAWRTPGYPLVIAGAMEGFGAHFAIAVRSLQVLLSILAAYFCMRAARIFFDETAARLSFLAGLFFPTLLYFSGEILSESVSAFFVALFLWMFAEDCANPRSATAVGMGLAIGSGALFRPNVAAIGAIGLAGAWIVRRAGRVRMQVALVPLCTALVFAPWIARNYHVFGRFVLSTKSGADALCGALNPESRFVQGWEDNMRALVGAMLPNDVETNAPSRLRLGSEIDLDHRCWQATRHVWNEMSWSTLAKWTLGKWGTYWLSTDQLLQPGQVSRRSHILHACAVFFYWLLLALACSGWWKLRQTRPGVAALLLGYAVLMTVVHTPFVMNTRIRVPVLDPLIVVLAGGGWVYRSQSEV